MVAAMTPPARDTSVKVGIGAADVNVRANADGSVVIDLNTRRRPEGTEYAPELYEANLLDNLGNSAVSSIQGDLDEGIRADIASRQESVDNYKSGLEMLGLKLEDRGVSDKTSKVRHPLLLWAIIKFQANARGEMLPSDGPAKIQNYGDVDPARADHLEERFNYYMTKKATEYYPDTDRALFYIGYGGTVFKKVYRCPRRNRPVSETVYMPDLIISNDTTDMENATRVTHQINGVTNSQMLQYMDMGYFSDVPLSQPTPEPTSTQQAEATVVGIKAAPQRSQDFPFTLWETTAFLDLERHGLKERGAPEGIPLPYTITMDKTSKQLLRVCRAWKKPREGEKPDFLTKRKVFFKWGMIPGIGYLDLGFLHLLGNHTRALTALERILIDAGIFSNFPGGVRSQGSRLETNIIMAGPGEFPEIDTGTATRIQDCIMALPFKGPTQEVLQLLQEIQKQGETIAGVIDITTGEGRKDIPVGTMLASIEQQTQVLTGVHRRLHTAQAEELVAIRDLLVDQPELLVDPEKPDEAQITSDELRSAQLVPVSDPNIPAHVHRLMQAVALDQLQQEHPMIFNEYTTVSRLLDIGHVNDKEQLLIPPEVFQMQQKLQQQAMQAAAQGGGATGPDPQTVIAGKQIDAAAKKDAQQIKSSADAQTKAQDIQAYKDVEQAKLVAAQQSDAAKAAAQQQSDATKTSAQMQLEAAKAAAQHNNDMAKIESQERMKGAELSAQAQSQDSQLASAELLKQAEIASADQRSQRELDQTVVQSEADRQQQQADSEAERALQQEQTAAEHKNQKDLAAMSAKTDLQSKKMDVTSKAKEAKSKAAATAKDKKEPK